MGITRLPIPIKHRAAGPVLIVTVNAVASKLPSLACLLSNAYNRGMKNAIVLLIDRLQASFLGPYGNTWIDTPSFNRLAAESALFEFAFTDSTDLSMVYRSMWAGLHAMSDPRPIPGLAEVALASGVRTVLITDEPQVADHPLASGFSEKHLVPTPPVASAAEDIGETQLARLLSSALDWLHHSTASSDSARRPFLLWIHSRGMQAPWDAPFDFRRAFADEDDPEPPDFVQPPCRWVAQDEDPDELLGIQHAYAGQISLLDACLAVFLEACTTTQADDQTLLLLTSPRGYPLGEHGRIGPADASLYGESLHVPCLVRYPDLRHAMQRCHPLVQPSDWYATLLDWFSLPRPSQSHWGNVLGHFLDGQIEPDRVCAVSTACCALRTATWLLLSNDDAGTHELFAKPDDRWEINEVSDRCRDVIPELILLLDEFERATRSINPPQFSAIPQSVASNDR